MNTSACIKKKQALYLNTHKICTIYRYVIRAIPSISHCVAMVVKPPRAAYFWRPLSKPSKARTGAFTPATIWISHTISAVFVLSAVRVCAAATLKRKQWASHHEKFMCQSPSRSQSLSPYCARLNKGNEDSGLESGIRTATALAHQALVIPDLKLTITRDLEPRTCFE